MANPEHLAILKQGVEVWNKWSHEYGIIPDLSGIDLSNTDLSYADLSYADLENTNLSGANLTGADLSEANLQGANIINTDFTGANLSGANLAGTPINQAILNQTKLSYTNLAKTNLFFDTFLISQKGCDFSGIRMPNADLWGANLTGANLERSTLPQSDIKDSILVDADLSGADLSESDLTGANLSGANLSGTNLSGANLSGANLSGTNLKGTNLMKSFFIETNLNNANIEGAKVYGISAWNIKKEGLIQKDLIITKDDEPKITVDDLEMAQFIYMMLNNQKIRDVIDTLTSKTVLILGRFSEERKPLLDAIKEELRLRNYLPILFDFEKPAGRNLTETISILAKMSRFVIADLTDAKSIPQELSHIVPFTPSLPVLPIILEGQKEYAMFEHFKAYPWVMPLHAYASQEAMLAEITEKIIAPAEQKAAALRAVPNLTTS